MYSIIGHKVDTIAKVLGSSPPNVTIQKDLVGLRLASWIALL
jgi:hypothetical protein